MSKRGGLPVFRQAVLAAALGAGALAPAMAPVTARAADAAWTDPTSGNWTDPARWTPAVVPNDGAPLPADTYAVTIAAAGPGLSPYAVTVSDPITVTSAKLNSPDATLEVTSGGSLTATNGLTLTSGALRLSGGQMLNTSVLGMSMVRVVPGATGTFDNVLITNPITVDSGAALRLRRNLRLSNGTLSLLEASGENTQLLIDGDVFLSRPGAVTFDGAGQAAILLDPASSTGSLSISPEITIRTGTGSGIIGQAGFTLDNSGVISAQSAGKTITILSALNNQRILEARDGGTLILPAGFINSTGTLRLKTDGTILLNGSASAADADPFAGTLDRTGGTLAITGPFFNGGATLSLDAIGPLELRSSTLGRNITGAGPSELIAATGVNTLAAAVTAPVRVNSGATLNFFTQAFKGLTINGGTAVLADAPTRQLLEVTSLNLDATGTLDLNDNDLIIRDPAGAAALPAVVDAIKRARGAGDWLGAGLTSSAARNDPDDLTTLAAISNDRGNGTPIFTTFAGQSVDQDAVLVMYTLYGDANFDGEVSIADFLRTDRGAARNLTGWNNGDFDYSGVVDAADYFLLDQSFLKQSAPAAASTSVHTSAVPEPSCLLLGLLALTGLRRRMSFQGRVT